MRTNARRILPVVTVGALVLAACGSSDEAEPASTDAAVDEGLAETESEAPADEPEAAPADDSCSNTLEDGVLTLATGEPVFEPWIVDNAPESGEGFEAPSAWPSPTRWATRATPSHGSAPDSTWPSSPERRTST